MTDQPIDNQENNDEPNDESNAKRRRTTDVFDTLGSSIQGMQSSFSSITSLFTNSISNTLAINQAMNEMYEQMFMSNIKKGSKLKPFEDKNGSGIQLTITITNYNRYPISGLSAHLTFEPFHKADTAATVAWTSESASETTVGSRNKKDVERILGSNQGQDKDQNQDQNQNQNSIPSTTIYTEILQIQPSEPCQYNSKLSVSVSSPGTGKPIEKEHKFGLYLIDQLIKTVHESGSSSEETKGSEKEYSTVFFREIMGLRPVVGIRPGMEIRLKAKQKEVMCKVVESSENLETVKAIFYGDHQLLDILLQELDILDI
ncbi:hypothetical protein PHYBLDRAFT_64378 [Phycomyces blakesleeanus NRRL 1555(-)]|uniref:Uncharacterized protein n=1 Tax=Phycomyces blakesleeanus (strain ATCC 8743b / DSM 1359 / FGSC 10004 / NBRC 33097 / NRRL 1555) TaxID=763407 RepID=A0A167NA64_PHYB8|nr:hypothetical protein PHYBLDRAFT_64378 [Phycomyces blakesleeanus NRRL 1555(-)]OAD75464.1 hypothetical protein PHYBLDRAFT_64378 [Phycomyces blakesleeanus NRRL 1555(-)]|eukprot:XP_018293504.1 hypothetical protein PHYBLDRAFT_64378 [Phycomyces blakesleeanus NRRL 1555(-)]